MINTITERKTNGRFLSGLGILGVAVAALMLVTVRDGGSNTASATTDGAAMSLEINGQTGKVTVPLGSTFDVVVMADAIPLANGYVRAVAWIEFGSDLTFKSSVSVWPDCNAKEVGSDSGTGAYRACKTGLLPGDQFGSVHKGSLFSFTLTCSSSQSSSQIDLIPSGQPPASKQGAGSTFTEFNTNNNLVPSVAGIEVNCSGPTPTPTLTPIPTPPESEMAFNVISGGNCDDPVRPTVCDVQGGDSFLLTVDATTAPSVGYGTFITWIEYGTELFHTHRTIKEEIVWPDMDAHNGGRVDGDTWLHHFAWSAPQSPRPPSFFLGPLVEVEMACPPSASSTLLELPFEGAGSGTVFWGPGKELFIPEWQPLRINCIELKNPDGDTDDDGIPNSSDPDDDNDGCTDDREGSFDETMGGRRNPHNPWDFYDVLGGGGGPPDGIIDLSNDIFGVIIHYAPTGSEPTYDVNFDRGPSAGPNPWNMTAPDGVIDLSNDILGVIQQYFHDCR